MPIQCNRCKEDKEPEAFAFKSVATGKRQSFCRICQSEWHKKHYRENKSKYVANSAASNRKLLERNRQFVFDYLLLHPCVECGESDPVVLEFDHIGNDKKNNVSSMVYRALSIKQIKLEIEKCQILCANCHRRKTARQLNWWDGTIQLTGD